ncbi:PREDICTED: myosin-14-like [Amphimedon queenslandica]|uniref:Death domain-containing protein n=1 Tax=Amphimedon queenslandica TaxID=400682 RepID=A0AAN0JWU0_AMPQE|nr:PREDICTED: myosin-14-like [Amphimedon queenslandica]|eukprot:XP_019861377.1 PREDICTED: myosin-14-like [Amphimedon queenslandica]
MASPGPAVNTNQLQITDLVEVLKLLRRHGYSGTSYYDLGLYLGLSPTTLDAIRDNERNVDSCLRECLKAWLQKADNVQKKGGPSIYSLVSVLRELGENGVADGIDMEKHPACRILAHYTSSQSLVIELVLLYHSENLIKGMILPNKTSGDDLLIQIKKSVCNDHRKLECERITIVVDEDAADRTIKDIKKLSKNIFKKLSPHIKLNVIKDGDSFTITCSFPLILSEQLITAALNNIDVLKENKVKRLTIGYCTVYEVKDTSTATTTEIDEYTSSLPTSSGLMKQLMLSLSVQLINSKEEVTALNGESMTMKKEVESLKETLDTKNRMLTASIGESERFKKIAEEIEKQSKAKGVESKQEIELLQEKISRMSVQQIEEAKSLKEALEKQSKAKEVESKQEIELLQEKISRMSVQQIEDSKEMVAMKKEAELLKEALDAKNKMLRVSRGESDRFKRKAEENEKQSKAKEVESKQEIELLQEKISMSVQQIEEAKSLKEALEKQSKAKEVESKQEIELLQKKISRMSVQQIEEAKSLKEALDAKNKMLSASIAESERFKRIAAETKQLLQEKVSRSTESEKENEKLKEIKELLEKQLALFQSEKEGICTFCDLCFILT